MEERIRSNSDIRQFLAGSFHALGPAGEIVATARDGVFWADLPKLGKSPLLNDDEVDYYVNEYARHGINGPSNWYRNREVNFVDEFEFFFENGSKLDARPTVEQEVLFIQATGDEALPPVMAETMGDYIPHLTRREVDCEHWALWERAEEVNDIVGRWLKEKILPEWKS